tara:strand:+ start:189 stop:1067 length:879 start_codon:yes stop_codon:yes gene_type:complete
MMQKLDTNSHKALKQKALWVRQKVLEMAVKSNSGHVTSAFSQTEMLVALYQGKILRYDPKEPKWEGRDRFILSKGQGGIGMYPILADAGYFPVEDLDHFVQRGSVLGVHAEWQTPGIEVLTGSLGHGLPIATGMAQAAINDNKDHLVFCFLGDAEIYEGSNWEAAIFAGHKGYENLVCIIDRNGQGVLGFTDDISGPSDGPCLNPLEDKFAAFGFDVRSIDGHNFDEIFKALSDIRNRKSRKPLMIISNTIKGKGAPAIENKRLWHYRVPKEDELKKTLEDLSLSEGAIKIK